MGIRDAFKLTWEQAVLRMAMLEGVEILPDSRIIIRTFAIKGYTVAQFCLLYGDQEYPKAISSRFTPDVMLIPAYLHIWEQRDRLKKAGITSRLSVERGLIQCVYISQEFAKVLQAS